MALKNLVIARAPEEKLDHIQYKISQIEKTMMTMKDRENMMTPKMDKIEDMNRKMDKIEELLQNMSMII